MDYMLNYTPNGVVVVVYVKTKVATHDEVVNEEEFMILLRNIPFKITIFY